MKRRNRVVLGLSIAAGMLSAACAHAQELRAYLTLKSAKAILAGCEAFAAKREWGLSIAVYDQGKNLIAFSRMDGAPIGSGDIAIWKANASAAFPFETKLDAEYAEKFPAIGFAPHVAVFEGGEAIFTRDGAHIGGVGVSGMEAEQDAECARAGIAAAGLSVRPR